MCVLVYIYTYKTLVKVISLVIITIMCGYHSNVPEHVLLCISLAPPSRTMDSARLFFLSFRSQHDEELFSPGLQTHIKEKWN